MGVLEQLFRGKINHTDWTPESEEYRKRLKRSGDIGSALKTGMTEEQNNMFEQYVDARGSIPQGIPVRCTDAEGVRITVR